MFINEMSFKLTAAMEWKMKSNLVLKSTSNFTSESDSDLCLQIGSY